MFTSFVECEYQNPSLGEITLASLTKDDRNVAIVFIMIDDSDRGDKEYFSEPLSVWMLRILYQAVSYKQLTFPKN